MKDTTPLVSIIILNLNRKNDLIKCINSIIVQTFNNYEIILIDNASSDGSVEKILELFPEVKIFKTRKNLGTSYTRNAGVKFSKGEFIWFLDNDVYLEDQYSLKKLMTSFSDNFEIDAIGGEAKINNNGKIIASKKLKLFSNGLTKGYFYENEIDKKILVEVIPTCNLLVKKNSIQKIGGFDHFYFFYLEDIDLTYRMTKFGFKLFVYHKCPIIHHFSEQSRFRNHFIAKRNRIYFIYKNFGLINIILLPINDFLFIFNKDSFKRIYNKFFQNQKYYNSFITESEKKISFKNILDSLKISFITVISILSSYIYIPFFYFKYSYKLKKNTNFLNEINENDFQEIKKMKK